jgi:quercetin dioxygenase-like cupin family protein
LVAFVTIRRGATLPAHRHPSLQHGCVELGART